MFLSWLLLPVFLLSSGFQINWLGTHKDAVRIHYQEDRSDFIRSCVHNKLKVRYRYNIQLCKRRSWWFQDCKKARRVVHTLEYDPITASYAVVMDSRLGDRTTIVRRYSSFDEAIVALSMIPQVRIAELSDADADFLRSSRLVIAARIVADCRGDYNRLFADISSFLTFGTFRISGFDTGRMGFDLERPGRE